MLLPAGAHGDLELPSEIGHANVFPLAAREDRRGLLIAAAPAPLSPILVEALAALGASVSLALESAALTEQALEHQSFHDAVTGLPNRALFSDRVAHALTVARLEHSSIAVIFLDLDDFKTVNDSLGHAAGDEVLQQVAARLRAAARPTDTVARFGGDEFAVLIEDVGDPVAAIDFAEQLAREFELPIGVAGKDLLIRASVGIALGGAAAGYSALDAGAVTRNAEAAMYICKREGGGGCRVFESAMHERALERLELRAELQRAIDESELEMHYQPVMGLRSGRVTGMEALVRWRHPTRGFVQPGQFIPLAEEMGLIVELGRWVLRESCRHMAEMHASGEIDPQFVLGVNLSVKQLQHPDVVADVEAALADSGMKAATLVLEITETVMMADYELASLTASRRSRISASPSRWTTSGRATRPSATSAGCRSTSSRWIAPSSRSTPSRRHRASPRRSSRSAGRSACGWSPRASSPQISTTRCATWAATSGRASSSRARWISPRRAPGSPTPSVPGGAPSRPRSEPATLVAMPRLKSTGAIRRSARRCGALVVVAAAAAVVGVPPGSAGNAAQSKACAAALVHYERDPAGDPRFDGLPWVKTKPEATGLRGRLFYYSSAGPSPPPWVRQRDRKLKIYTGGADPRGQRTMKILWTAGEEFAGEILVVRGRSTAGRSFRQVIDVGPSTLEIPSHRLLDARADGEAADGEPSASGVRPLTVRLDRVRLARRDGCRDRAGEDRPARREARDRARAADRRAGGAWVARGRDSSCGVLPASPNSTRRPRSSLLP